jgi:hypothetical protein
MFGLYELQLPSALQNRLVDWSNRQRGGHHIGVAVMGLLSALIVGPCVAPPLIGVLTFIAVTGDLTLGAAALFALSLGMGAPLLLIGASAGHWLPRMPGTGWSAIKAVFGVLLLAVALWLLDRILPAAAEHGVVGDAADRDRNLHGRTAAGGAWRAGLAHAGQGPGFGVADLRRSIAGWSRSRRARSVATLARNPVGCGGGD